jgi:hypothetical protein
MPYTYDTIYKFFTPFFQKLLLDTVLAQGSTAFNFYMGYGGTNWGAIGDPDVYTSYDYSASIREFRFLSEKGRNLRLGALFCKGFEEYLSRTNVLPLPNPLQSEVSTTNKWHVVGVVEDVIRDSKVTLGHWVWKTMGMYKSGSEDLFKALDIRQRLSLHSSNPMTFVLVRNFNDARCSKFQFMLRNHRDTVELNLTIPYKHSFLAIGNYLAPYAKLNLVFSTCPIYFRMTAASKKNKIPNECWFIQCDEMINGEMCFESHISVTEGTLKPKITFDEEANVSIVNFSKRDGWCGLYTTDPAKQLIVVAISKEKLQYLNGVAESGLENQDVQIVVLGGYRAELCSKGQLLVDYNLGHVEFQSTHIIPSYEWMQNNYGHGKDWDLLTVSSPTTPSSFDDEIWNACPLVLKSFQPCICPPSTVSIDLVNWKRAIPGSEEYAALPWTEIPLDAMVPVASILPWKRKPQIGRAPLDFGYASGHVLYKCTFTIEIKNSTHYEIKSDPAVTLKLNVRHRGTIWCNNRIVGGHLTYSLQAGQVGSKMGYDRIWGGITMYDLTEYVIPGNNNHSPTHSYTCELLILVESFGMNRQTFFFDDVRNPRGVLSAEIVVNNHAIVKDQRWYISGVDATKLQNPYNTSGVPFEKRYVFNDGETPVNAWINCSPSDHIDPNDGIHFYRFEFQAPNLNESITYHPLQIVIDGNVTACIFLNKVLVGRYHGQIDSPQKSFYLLEGLLRRETSESNEVVLLVYSRALTNMNVQISAYSLSGDGSGNWVDLNCGMAEFVLQKEIITI